MFIRLAHCGSSSCFLSVYRWFWFFAIFFLFFYLFSSINTNSNFYFLVYFSSSLLWGKKIEIKKYSRNGDVHCTILSQIVQNLILIYYYFVFQLLCWCLLPAGLPYYTSLLFAFSVFVACALHSTRHTKQLFFFFFTSSFFYWVSLCFDSLGFLSWTYDVYSFATKSQLNVNEKQNLLLSISCVLFVVVVAFGISRFRVLACFASFDSLVRVSVCQLSEYGMCIGVSARVARVYVLLVLFVSHIFKWQ